MKKPFVAVIGAGNVGATAAQRIAEKNISDVILLDVMDGFAKGKALDLMQSAPIEQHTRKIEGTTNYDDIAGAEITVVTAGLARKPGMSREDLLMANAKIIRSICENVKRVSPNTILLTVTNPLDIMTQYAFKLTGFPKERVVGMAGVLDSARMRFFLAEKLGKHPHEVDAMVLGGHGDLMVPVMSQVKVAGKPLSGLKPDEIQQIIQRTQQGGAEIVALLKTGSAFYAPGSSVAQMVDAILNDRDTVLPVCAYCTGEFGIKNMYCGVPAKLGKKGLRQIVEIPLSDTERRMLHTSADKVKKGVEELETLEMSHPRASGDQG